MSNKIQWFQYTAGYTELTEDQQEEISNRLEAEHERIMRDFNIGGDFESDSGSC